MSLVSFIRNLFGSDEQDDQLPFGRLLTDDERRLLEITIEVDSPVHTALKRQIAGDYLLGISRRVLNGELMLDFVIDTELGPKVSMDRSVSFSIDDVWIKLVGLSHEVKVIGYVIDGRLVGVGLNSEFVSSWPTTIKIENWFYGAQPGSDRDGSHDRGRPAWLLKAEEMLSRTETPEELPDGQLGAVIESSNDGGLGIKRWPPASEESIRLIENELSSNLPSDYKQFLKWANGAFFWGVRVFGTTEIYTLETPDVHKKLVVIAKELDGSVIGLALEDDFGSVLKVDISDGAISTIAASFTDWIRSLSDSY